MGTLLSDREVVPRQMHLSDDRKKQLHRLGSQAMVRAGVLHRGRLLHDRKEQLHRLGSHALVGAGVLHRGRLTGQHKERLHQLRNQQSRFFCPDNTPYNQVRKTTWKN